MVKNRISLKNMYQIGVLVSLDITKYCNTNELRQVQSHWSDFENSNSKFRFSKHRLDTKFVGEYWRNLHINIILDILKPEDIWRESVVLGLHHRWPKELDVSNFKPYLVFSQYYSREYLLFEEEMKKVT